MAKSPLPKNLKIRVLTTIENGEVQQEIVRDDALVCTLKEFVMTSHDLGCFITHKSAEPDVKEIRSCAKEATQILDTLISKFPDGDTSDECMKFREIDAMVQDIRYHLNKIFPEK